VERGDRRQRVGEVVEDEHEVGLDEARQGDADRVRGWQRDGRLEDGDRVVGEGADGAAGEAGHPVGRLDPAPRQEGAERGERVGGRQVGDGEVGRVVDDPDRPVLDAGPPAANLEEAPRPDPQEAVATEALAALDGLEQIGRGGPVVEAEEGADRSLQVGVAHRLQADRVRAPGEALDLTEAEGVLAGHRGGLRKRERPLVLPGRKVEPSAVPPGFGVCRTHRDRRDGFFRSALPAIAGALRRSLLAGAPARRWGGRPGPRSVRRLPGPFAVVAAPASTSRRVSVSAPRRVLVPFTAAYELRSRV